MIRKRKFLIFKTSPKKRTTLYSILKYLLILALVICLCLLFIHDESLTNHSYYPSHFAQVTISIISTFSALYAFIIIFKYIWQRDYPNTKKKYRYQPMRLKISLGTSFVFLLLGSVIIAFAFKQLTAWVTNSLFSGITNLLGTEISIPVEIKEKIFVNPDYQHSITIGSGKYSHTLIDPAPYKIVAKIFIKDHQYILPIHCYTGHTKLQLISKQYDLDAKISLLGFRCTSQCTLNYRFQTIHHQPVTAQDLTACEDLYNKTYQETINS